MNTIVDEPTIVQLPYIEIPEKTVLRRLGSPLKKHEMDGEVKRLYSNEVKKAHSLIHPQGVYRFLKVLSREDDLIRFQNDSYVLQSDQVNKMLCMSDPIGFIMVTIGSQLEEEVKRLFSEGEMASGIVLDAIGSETADAAADYLHHVVLKKLAEKEGYSITPRFSPGYGNWSLTVQSELLRLCKGELIGISVNASSFMIPQKSISAVLGWERKNIK